jgi:hypothetical protein
LADWLSGCDQCYLNNIEILFLFLARLLEELKEKKKNAVSHDMNLDLPKIKIK